MCAFICPKFLRHKSDKCFGYFGDAANRFTNVQTGVRSPTYEPTSSYARKFSNCSNSRFFLYSHISENFWPKLSVNLRNCGLWKMIYFILEVLNIFEFIYCTNITKFYTKNLKFFWFLPSFISIFEFLQMITNLPTKYR